MQKNNTTTSTFDCKIVTRINKENLTSTQRARQEERIEAASNGERHPTSHQVSN